MSRPLEIYVNEFLAYLVQRGRSPYTIQTYQQGLRLFCQFYHGQDIAMFTTPDVTEWKKQLEASGYAPTTINTRLAVIRRFVNYLRVKEDMRFSKDLEFDLIPVDDGFLDYVLFRSDIDRLLRATRKFKDTRAEAIIATLAFTGVRVHELLQIPVSAVQQKSLRIKGKRGKYRTVFIPTIVRNTWKTYLGCRKDNSTFLFTGKRGVLTRRRVHDVLKYYAGQARLKKAKVHAHAFRHFCAKYLHDVEGYSISECMSILGHKDPKTFLIYTKPTREEMEKKMQGSFKNSSHRRK